jgi:hypothetical protein
MRGLFFLAPLLLFLGCGYSAHSGVNQIQLAIYPKVCIDVLGASTAEGAHVQIYPCGAEKRSQQWSIVPVNPQGDVLVVNLNSSKCMAVDPTFLMAPGEYVIQETCSPDNSALNQLWKITPQVNDPGSRFVSVATGQCLDLPYGAAASIFTMQQYYCTDGDPAQGWVINPVAPGTIP